MIPIPSTRVLVAAVGLLCAAAGLGAGWAANGWRLSAELAQERERQARTAWQAIDLAERQRDDLATKLARLDADATAQLRKLSDENETLRGRVAAGAVVVRIRGAACPSVVPPPSPGGGLDSGGGAALDPQAGSAVLDLRRDALRVGEKLAACQGALRALTGQ